MSIEENIRKDMFVASKAGSGDEADILKMALAAIKDAQIEAQKELTDSDIEKILRKETRKILDSIEQYEKLGREELLNREKVQLEVLNKYLPKLMSLEEVQNFVVSKIKELNAQGMKDMGKVMSSVMQEIGSKTDGNTVKDIVSELLK